MTDSTTVNGGLRLRPMEPADLPAALALWEATEGMGMGAGDSLADLESFLARNPGISVVAVAADGTLAGAVLGGHDGRRGALYHLAVRRDRRGTGLGRALAERCVETLRAAGVGKVNILVFGDNEAGRAFWRHTGWRERPDLRVMQVVFPAGTGASGAGGTAPSRGTGAGGPAATPARMDAGE